MRTLAGNTWGISGPTFIWMYIVLVAVALTAVIVVPRLVRVSRAVTADETRRLETSPVDVAYLNGGADLAIVAAYSALSTIGAVTTVSGGKLAAASVDVPPDLPPLAHAVYEAARHRVHPARMSGQEAIAAELAAIRRRLTASGLLLSPVRRGLARWISLALPLVFVFGIVRLAFGIAGHKPFGYLLLCLIGCFLATTTSGLWQSRATQTRAGSAVLGELRARHTELDPKLAPSWTSYGPAAAALAVGMYGVDALWRADPRLAQQLEPLTAPTTGNAATLPGTVPGPGRRTGLGFGRGTGVGGGMGGGGGFGGGGGCGG